MKIQDAIADTGMRTAALGALLELELVDTEVLQRALESGIEAIRANPDYWYEEDGERRLDTDECAEEILQHAIAALGAVEVSADALAAVTSLDFDGGNEIYMWLEATTAELLGLGWELDTGGESELYVVDSFAGVQALARLEALNLDAYGWVGHERDATPLAELAALAELDLCGAQLSNADALTKLPALRRVRGADKLPAAVREALQAKGVELA